MANHKSSKKRIRQTETNRLHNRYYMVTLRNALRKMRSTTEKSEAEKQVTPLTSMLDKLANRDLIHKNKAANLKSKLSKFVKSLQA